MFSYTKLLLVFVLFSSFFGSAQEDYNIKPWSKNADYKEQAKIVILEDGTLLEHPEFLYKRKLFDGKVFKMKGDSSSLSNCFITIVDKKGVAIKSDKYRIETMARLRKNLNGIKKLKGEEKKRVEELFATYGFNFTDYLSYVAELLKGQNPSLTKYDDFFPNDFHKIFADSTLLKGDIQIHLKASKEVSTELCNCSNPEKIKYADSSHLCKAQFISNDVDDDYRKYSYSVEFESPEYDLMHGWMDTLLERIKDTTTVIDAHVKRFLKKESCLPTIRRLEKGIALVEVYDAACLKQIYDSLVVSLQSYKRLEDTWEISWAWFSGNFSEDAFSKKDADILGYTKDKLDSISNKIKAIELMMGSGSSSLDVAYTESAEELVKLQIEKTKIDNLLKASTKRTTEIKTKYLTQKTAIYSGEFYVSDWRNKIFMRNHDGADKYLPFEDQRTIYYDHETVTYLVHNFGEGDKRVHLSVTGKAAAEPQVAWVSDVNSIFTTLSPTLGLDVEAARTNMGNSATEMASGPDFEQRKKAALLTWKSLKESQAMNKWMLATLKTDTTILSTLGKTKEITPGTKSYQLPATISYNFQTYKADNSTNKKYEFNDGFTYYKRKYVQTYAGFNVSVPGVTTILLDETVSPLAPTTETRHLQFTAGIKVYPFGGILKDGRMALSLRRFHLIGGVSIPKPLANFYMGAGYDIVPGWNVHCDFQLYRDHDYVIENGSVTSDNTIYRPTWSIGMGVDATVFINAFQFIFK